MDRYSRQSVLSSIGPEGQRKIEKARVAIVGLGALGSVSAQLCARAGVGYLRLIDRDVVELSNLQRQVLFTEKDVREGRAKASAAKKRLGKINSEIEIEARVEDLNAANIPELLQGIDVVLDGTDNFEARYLLNDYAVKNKLPFVYGGAVETQSMVYAVIPGRPCLRCLFPEKPGSQDAQTCDRSGILASAAHWTAALQFTRHIQILTGAAVPADLETYDMWRADYKKISSEKLAVERCEACTSSRFPALEIQAGTQTLKLCGRNAVQIQTQAGHGLVWDKLEERWKRDAKEVRVGADVAYVTLPDCELTLFKSGRVIVKGTEDPALAKSIYARYIGY